MNLVRDLLTLSTPTSPRRAQALARHVLEALAPDLSQAEGEALAGQAAQEIVLLPSRTAPTPGEIHDPETYLEAVMHRVCQRLKR